MGVGWRRYVIRFHGGREGHFLPVYGVDGDFDRPGVLMFGRLLGLSESLRGTAGGGVGVGDPGAGRWRECGESGRGCAA